MQFLFDTNIYLDLIEDREYGDFKSQLKKLKSIENERGFDIPFPVIPAIELLSHLSDDVPYNAKKIEKHKALSFLIRHSYPFDNQPYCIPTYHDMITFTIFGKVLGSGLNHFVIDTANEAGIIDNMVGVDRCIDKIRKIAKFRQEEREGMINNLKYYLSTLNDGEVDLDIFDKKPELKKVFDKALSDGVLHELFGVAMIKMVADILNKPLPKKAKIKEFLSIYEVSIDFFIDKILQNIAKPGANKEYIYEPLKNLKKHKWNSFYDMQLIFATEYENHFGRKTILVTKDKKIIEQFKKFNKSELVTTFDGYKENFLNRNDIF